MVAKNWDPGGGDQTAAVPNSRRGNHLGQRVARARQRPSDKTPKSSSARTFGRRMSSGTSTERPANQRPTTSAIAVERRSQLSGVMPATLIRPEPTM